MFIKKRFKNYLRGEHPITDRPGAILKPELDQVKINFSALARDIDDELLCALYSVTGERYNFCN